MNKKTKKKKIKKKKQILKNKLEKNILKQIKFKMEFYLRKPNLIVKKNM